MIGKMKQFHYYTRPKNIAYHNLCLDASPPPGIASLLGLGLKFCIEKPKPKQKIAKSLQRFQRTVRLHFYFSNQEEKREDEVEAASIDPDKTMQ